MADTKGKVAEPSNGVEGAEASNGVEGAEPLDNKVTEVGVVGGDTLVDTLSLIMRQTGYDRDTAQQKMVEHNNDVMQVIREYMAPAKPIKKCTTKLSVNQQIYKEIRGMMDDAAKRYELEKAKQMQEQQS
jgi:hypothetical protein